MTRPAALVAVLTVAAAWWAGATFAAVPVAAVAGAGTPGEATAWSAPPPGTYRPPVSLPVVDPFRPPAGPYGPGNRGLEYGAVGGEPVRAVAAGVVRFAGAVAGRLAVTVGHPDGRRSSLTGLAVVLVRAGDRVRQGDLVGLAAPGLHLGVREGDRYVDPAALFDAAPRHAWLVPSAISRAAGPVAMLRPGPNHGSRSA